MKYTLTIACCILFFHPLFSQSENDVKKDLDRAKHEMRYSEDVPDYKRAGKLLETVVTRDSSNAEAWYFFGYALDKINVPDGERMLNASLSLTLQSSISFENAILLSKDSTYQGDRMLLDPHTKILTVWGMQAIRYLSEGNRDSAIFCFNEAERRGGINGVMTKYFETVLDGCSQDAFLFTAGDIYLYYLTYLQTVKKYRTDVKCIDLNLLNTQWYPEQLLKNDSTLFSYKSQELAKISHTQWRERLLTILNKKASSETADTFITWQTPSKQTWLRSDILLLNILQQNAFKKNVFIPRDVPSDMCLYIDDYLSFEGLTSSIIPDKKINHIDAAAAKLKMIKPLTSSSFINNPDNIQVLNNYRFAYGTAAEILLKTGNVDEAKVLMESAEIKFPGNKLPFFDPSAQKWYGQLKKLVNTFTKT